MGGSGDNGENGSGTIIDALLKFITLDKLGVPLKTQNVGKYEAPTASYETKQEATTEAVVDAIDKAAAEALEQSKEASSTGAEKTEATTSAKKEEKESVAEAAAKKTMAAKNESEEQPEKIKLSKYSFKTF